ncbi:MAG: PAS domain S-box protein [Desulfobacterota bacterium]|nr:PAS domain S-box protein [Thermodesulfobacteriota bacterium]
MKTQTRITLLLAVVALLFIGGFVVVRIYEQQREELIIKRSIYEKNTLFDRMVRIESASLELFAYDFSNRDDIAQIVSSPAASTALRLLERSMPSYNVTALWIYDPDLRPVHAINPAGINGIDQISDRAALVADLFSRSFFSHFFINSPAGIVEFRTAPLQPADDILRASAPRGFLIAARLWLPAYVHDLEVLTDCSIAFSPIDTDEVLETSTYDPRSGAVHFSRVVYGWNKKPLCKIRISSQPPLARELQHAAGRQVMLIAAFAGAVILLLSILLVLWVNLPLRRISESLRSENPALLKNLPRSGTEFGALAQLILNFFRQRDALRQEVQERGRAQEALAEALDASRRREAETAALLAAARAILEHHDFTDAAGSILELALKLSSARAGFIAERDANEQVLRTLCSSFPDTLAALPVMPLQGMYAQVCASGKPLFDNAPQSALPSHHPPVDNIMCVPLLIDRSPAALLVLANKDGGFTDTDIRMGAAFGELASVALLNSRTRASLEASEERFRSVVETAGDAIITVTSDDRIVFWNSGAERMFGYRAAEVVGKPAGMLLPERLRTVYERTAQQGLQHAAAFMTTEMIGRRSDGSEFPMELSRSSWKTKDGMFYTAIIRDITERKQAEQQLRESEQRLRMQDKMASLGRVAAGIAHEIRNPLSGITTYTYMLRRYAAERPDAERQDIDDIATALQTASDRIEAVIRRVMDFSKPSAPKLLPLNLNDAVSAALALAATTIRKSGVALTTELAPGLPLCRADRALIEQAVLNLLTNAVQALQSWHGEKRITVQTRHELGTVVISVADSGPGVAPEDRPKIFDPFFTTKPDGSGIGLSLCQRIVTDHKGLIQVGTSMLGGAEFTIYLPVYNGHAHGAEASAA